MVPVAPPGAVSVRWNSFETPLRPEKARQWHLDTPKGWKRFEIDPATVADADGHTCAGRAENSVCGQIFDGVECVDLCPSPASIKRMDTKLRSLGLDDAVAPLAFLPPRYPAPPSARDARDAAAFARHLERTQQLSAAPSPPSPSPPSPRRRCDYARVFVGRDEPRAGMGVNFAWATTALVRASLLNVTFTPGPDFMHDFARGVGSDAAAPQRCGAGAANALCFFAPPTPCLNAAATARVPLARPFARFALTALRWRGSFWTDAHALSFWWRLNAPTRAFVRRLQDGMRTGSGSAPSARGGGGSGGGGGLDVRAQPTIAMQVRRGDACASGRPCPALARAYLPAAERLRALYGVTHIFVATDDESVVAECRRWRNFTCAALAVDRARYNVRAGFLDVERRARGYFESRLRSGDAAAGDAALSALEFIADVETLGSCAFFVGQFASSVARLAYQLIFARQGRHVPFVSIESGWAQHPDGRMN